MRNLADLCHPNIPEGVSGDWSVERFHVDARAAGLEAMRAMFSSSSRGRGVPEGDYTKLSCRGATIMSDTPDELSDHMEFLWQVERHKGSVLINGLGLGCALLGAISLGAKRVTVIEKEEDVIRLVARWFVERFRSMDLCILHADALTWQPEPGTRYSAVWHDIWPNICGDNLPEMKKLHRKYGRRTDWQGSWCRERCER